MADSVPAVGSLISLISRTGIRYEGSMYTVYLSDSTIALSHGERGGAESRRERAIKKRVLMTTPSIATTAAA